VFSPKNAGLREPIRFNSREKTGFWQSKLQKTLKNKGEKRVDLH
jgi:hypothetical protein